MNEKLSDKVWLSPQEAADYLGVARGTIYKWADEGKITIYKGAGKTARLKREELDRFIIGE